MLTLIAKVLTKWAMGGGTISSNHQRRPAGPGMGGQVEPRSGTCWFKEAVVEARAEVLGIMRTLVVAGDVEVNGLMSRTLSKRESI